MYYVNTQQIEKRLHFVPQIVSACEELMRIWVHDNVILQFAQERALQLVIESVTDVGSLLIDGFLMRDAGSYEDIVEILRGETVFSDELAESLVELVRLRKPLIQEYTEFDRSGLHPMIRQIPGLMHEFSSSITRYLQQELGN